MSYDKGIVDLAAEAMAAIGDPSARPMMGGATLYCGGLAYAIVVGDGLWFKADAASDVTWDAAGAVRFSYPRHDGTVATMNYRHAPDEVYDDPDDFRRWALVALQAARRAPVRTKKGRGRAGAP